MKALAVLVAAGSSTRMEGAGGVRKPLVELRGRSILEHACEPFARCDGITDMVLVVHADDVETVQGWCGARPAFAKVRDVVPGGAARIDSVRLGLGAAPRAHELVCIHDAARPLVSTDAVEAVLAAATRDGAALLAVAVRDTLKGSQDGVHVERTVDRDGLWAAQTPQAFDATRFAEILTAAARDGFRPTDDAALWERYVGPVTIVPGDATNLKLTHASDLALVEALLAARKEKGT